MNYLLHKTLGLALLAMLCPKLSAQDAPKRQVAEAGVLVAPSKTSKKSLKWKVAIGRFSNETQYGKGVFYDRANDPMAKQALDILSTKLAAADKFILIERSDMELIEQEVKLGSPTQRIGADYLILGSITEFGRKTSGKEGLFTSQKTQTVEAGVSLRVVDVSTGLVIYSEEGKGLAETSSKTTLGFGGQAGFDATLSDKAISGAIEQLVENIINKCSDKPWRTYIIHSDADATIIAGGRSQGLNVGDIFDIYARGKRVKNPQTGVTIELPGKRVGSVRVESLGGDTPETEYALVSLRDGSFEASKLDMYYIEARSY